MDRKTPLRRLLAWIDDYRWRHKIGWEACDGDVTFGFLIWRDVFNKKRKKPDYL